MDGIVGPRGTGVRVDDARRAAYHAAASIAANHLVALLGQVERVAATAGLPSTPLPGWCGRPPMTPSLSARAWPSPARRRAGDWATVDRHRGVLSSMAGHRSELAAYDALVALARRLSLGDAGESGSLRRSVAAVAGGMTAVAAAPAAPAVHLVGGPTPETVAVIETIAELTSSLDAVRLSGRTVGLVPTMGALHDGHRALIAQAAAECDVVVVTVFVNPTQFGDPADLAAYPRTLDADLAVAASAGACIVFAPSVEEMYPDGRRRPRRPRCRCRASAERGRARRGRATSTVWPPWWSSCWRWPGGAGPTSARRTSSSWPSCAGW